MKYWLIVLLLLLNPVMGNAAIYMQQDSHGNVTYSDTPLTSTAKEITVQPPDTVSSPASSSVNLPSNSAPVIPPPPVTAIPTSTEPVIDQGQRYTNFFISSPTDQQTIQNQPTIPVEITLEPKLQTGNTIQLILDGQPAGSAVASVHPALGLVERGRHQLSAVILDQNQRILQQSNTITIFVQRVGLNSPQRSQITNTAP